MMNKNKIMIIKYQINSKEIIMKSIKFKLYNKKIILLKIY